MAKLTIRNDTTEATAAARGYVVNTDGAAWYPHHEYYAYALHRPE
ncbi:MAG TPA: hypothetical protein VEK37_07745 [Gemmatimonadaceae bacterium]|nr:hypothetical protein [Gemmatimonadaceae bacterium]